MNIEQEWLQRLWSVVDQEAAQIDGKLPSGYRAVSEKTGIAYDYIYQMYQGKPKERPRLPTKQVMQKIEAVYGPGEPRRIEALKQSSLTTLAESLGKLFDQIPEENLVARSLAYGAATQAIVSVLQGLPAKHPVENGQSSQ